MQHQSPDNGSVPYQVQFHGPHASPPLVAESIDSRYEPGQRSGAWLKMLVNQGQKFVIGGYTPAGRNFDAVIFGYYDDEGRLVNAARTRNGFTPASRKELTEGSSGWRQRSSGPLLLLSYRKRCILLLWETNR